MEPLVDIQVRVFGLDATLSVQPDRQKAIVQQWEWCLPDSPAQRTIPTIPSSSQATQTSFTVPRAADDPQTLSPNTSDYRLTTAVTSHAINRRRGEYFMLHSGGIARADGRVAGLIAASGTGKTTAIRHLCEHRGYGYVTDETLIFNSAGQVMPYPKPLSVIPPGKTATEKQQYSPSELGFAFPPDGDLRVGPFILLNRVRDEADTASAPQLTPMDLLDGLALLLPQSSAIPSIPDCLFHLVSVVTQNGGFLELRYREIAETHDLIEEAFTTPVPTQEWRHIPGNWHEFFPGVDPYAFAPRTNTLPDVLVTADTSIVRGPFVDALSVDGDQRTLVLRGNNPITLAGIGAMVWLLAEKPLTVSEALAECIAIFGDHPTASDAILTCINEMLAFGLLTYPS